MKRRSFLKALLALPVVGRILEESAPEPAGARLDTFELVSFSAVDKPVDPMTLIEEDLRRQMMLRMDRAFAEAYVGRPGFGNFREVAVKWWREITP